MTDKTPGRSAYEAMHASRMKRPPFSEGSFVPWDRLDETWDADEGDGLHREDMEAAANAAIDTAGDRAEQLRSEVALSERLRDERDEYRRRLAAIRTRCTTNEQQRPRLHRALAIAGVFGEDVARGVMEDRLTVDAIRAEENEIERLTAEAANSAAMIRQLHEKLAAVTAERNALKASQPMHDEISRTRAALDDQRQKLHQQTAAELAEAMTEAERLKAGITAFLDECENGLADLAALRKLVSSGG